MNFFGTKKVDPIEQAKEWKRNLAREARKLDRDILALQRAEKRAIKECKTYAKKVCFNLLCLLLFCCVYLFYFYRVKIMLQEY